MNKKRCIIEMVKNLLITALACSALWLVADSQLLGQLSGVLDDPGRGENAASIQTEGGQMIVPVKLAVMTREGCCGVQYDGEEVAWLFRQFAPILNEAICAAGQPRPVPEAQWRRALTCAPGIWLDLQGRIPLQILCRWLSGAENNNLTGDARHVLLCMDEERKVLLYYCDEQSGSYFVSQVDDVNPTYFENMVSQFSANGALFACQTEYEVLAADTLISPQTPQPVEYYASNPLSVDESSRLEELLDALSFPIGITTVYDTPEGRRARSGNDTLSVSNSGVVTYESSPGEDRYPVPYSEGDSELFGVVEAARQMVCSLLERWNEEAGVYLHSVEQDENGWMVRFGYALDNIPVQVGRQGYAASVKVERGYITQYEIQLRSYAPLTQTTAVLPERQAAAIVAQKGYEGRHLQLCYQDSGNIVRAGWVVE